MDQENKSQSQHIIELENSLEMREMEIRSHKTALEGMDAQQGTLIDLNSKYNKLQSSFEMVDKVYYIYVIYLFTGFYLTTAFFTVFYIIEHKEREMHVLRISALEGEVSRVKETWEKEKRDHETAVEALETDKAKLLQR